MTALRGFLRLLPHGGYRVLQALDGIEATGVNGRVTWYLQASNLLDQTEILEWTTRPDALPSLLPANDQPRGHR